MVELEREGGREWCLYVLFFFSPCIFYDFTGMFASVSGMEKIKKMSLLDDVICSNALCYKHGTEAKSYLTRLQKQIKLKSSMEQSESPLITFSTILTFLRKDYSFIYSSPFSVLKFVQRRLK